MTIRLALTALASAGSASADAGATAPRNDAAAGASALDGIATELAAKLGAAASGAHVVAPVVACDVPGAREAELGARLAERVSAHLTKDTKAAPGIAAGAATDRSAARVVLQARITRGLLGVTADLYAAQGNGWDRVRSPSPPAAVHSYATARIDAEVRSFLPPIALEQATLHKAKAGFAADDDVIALGCGAIEPGGPLDLVVVTRARVKVGRIVHGAFAATDDIAWSDLAPHAPMVLREPLGGVVFEPRFAVGTSDRGGVYLARGEGEGAESLHADGLFAGIPVSGTSGRCAHVSPQDDAFSGPLDACNPVAVGLTGATAATAMPAPIFDTIAISTIVQKNGAASPLVAARSPDGAVHLTYAGAPPQTWMSAGAQLAALDLDLDGRPEVATTRGSDPDAILVTTYGEGKPRLYFTAPLGVRALAACPAEDRGLPALAAIVGDEVWIVR